MPDSDKEHLSLPKATEAMCRNMVGTSFDDLSEWNVKCFKDRLLDATGCIFGGAIVRDNDVLVSLFKRWAGFRKRLSFVTDFRAPANNAVILNCVMARSNDFSNMFLKVHGERMASHLGETLIPWA